MESQPQNTEFRINPENFHPCNNLTCFIQPISIMFISKEPGSPSAKMSQSGFTCPLAILVRCLSVTSLSDVSSSEHPKIE